jgi:cysteine desulfuration protein SufE
MTRLIGIFLLFVMFQVELTNGFFSFFVSKHRLDRSLPSSAGRFSSQTIHSMTLYSTNPFGIDTNKYSAKLAVSEADIEALCMPTRLRKLSDYFRSYKTEKQRLQKLLEYSENLREMPDELKIPENQVQGCLSTVYIAPTLNELNRLNYTGFADTEIVRGLVRMLTVGLSNCTVEEIIALKPDFMAYTGFTQTLTSSRNNGFLNMLNLMKVQAEIVAEHIPKEENNYKPIEACIRRRLELLEPLKLEIINCSEERLSEEERRDFDLRRRHNPKYVIETIFNITIASKSFEGFASFDREEMVRILLSNELYYSSLKTVHLTTFLPNQIWSPPNPQAY